MALEDRVRVDGQELLLNGAALRTRVIFKVYVAGLYLPAKATTAQSVLEAKGAKRILLVMVRDAAAQQFVESTEAGMRANNMLDYAPSEGGTTLFVDGVAQGRPMPGEAFYQALLRIWLGDDPVQVDLKEALLGGVQ